MTMKRLVKYLLLALMLFGASWVNAQTITLSGTHPTTRTDGTALTIEEIDRYEVGCNSTGASGPFEEWRYSIPRDSLIAGHQEAAPMDSTWHCIAMTVDTGGLVSSPSNVASTTWLAPPGPLEDLQFSCFGDCNTTLNFNFTIAQ